MKLTPSTAQELRDRLSVIARKVEELRAQANQAEKEALAIRTILGDSADAEPERPDTLAGRVRVALRHMNRQATPAEVVERLMAEGEDKPKSELSIAVSSILHRLASGEKSPIARVARGQYKFNPEVGFTDE